MYESICYKKPFLKEVIVRIDFAAPLETLGKIIPNSVGNIAVSLFPISEPRKAVAQEFQVSESGMAHKIAEFTEWNYYGRDREKRLALAPSYVLATYNSYSTYEKLRKDFLAITDSLFRTYPDLRGSRLGLRYINNIEITSNDPLKWDKFFDKRLLGLFNRYNEINNIARIFHIVEFKFVDLQVKFQFGLPNPDFPAVVKRPIFILDLDAYLQGLQDFSDISGNLDRAHDQIQRLFEESITDGLRDLMNA